MDASAERIIMKIIDTHCHIYPDKIAQKASNATGSFYGLPPSLDGTVATLLEKGKKAGIDRYVVNSVATTPAQVHSINTFIAATVAAGGGIFTGMGTLHPDSDDLERDVSEILKLGLKGIKLHPDIQRFKTDDKRAMDIFALAEMNHLPVCVHTGDYRYDYSNPNRIKPVLEAFPDLLMIGAHFGGWSMWEDASHEYAKYDNIIVDCSSSLYSMTPDKAKELIRLYGASRVMFGTDYPLWDPIDEIERFMKIDLTEEEKEKILYKNASELFGISF